MSQLDYPRAILIGAIQGLTEFLPISSSGHLAVVQRWTGLDPGSGEMLLLDGLVHVATLIAVVVVFAASARRFVARLIRETGNRGPGWRFGWRILGQAAAATAVTGAIGLTCQGAVESAFDRPGVVGSCFFVTGISLAVTVLRKRGARGWKQFRWWQAVVVGLAQSAGLFPGISRSGTTIAVALFCGLRRRWAAEFSFLIAVPAILGAAAIKAKDTLELPPAQLSAISWGPILVASVVSLVVGVVALRILLNVVRRAKLHFFAAYCWLVGGLVLSGIV